MEMAFCRGCGKEMHRMAAICTKCGCVEDSGALSGAHLQPKGTLWVPVVALVFAIISLLAVLDGGELDGSAQFSLSVCTLSGLLLGTLSIQQQRAGTGMAISAVVLSSLALLGQLGQIL